MQHSISDHFYKVGVIPVVEIDSAQHARPLAETLLEGGLPVAEITLRTDAALESIRVIARGVSGVIVGAGTVINRDQAQAACEAGAQFLPRQRADPRLDIHFALLTIRNCRS
jgi:2-dehydro-3-deoxyphosphogluconate aldolase/(4S)-4-hydroxy-2-oxoglutarate aldolase